MSEFLTKGSSIPASPPLARHMNLPSRWPGFLVGQADKPVRVLLVDNDPNISRVIAQELLGQGASLKDGRRLIRQHQFDVMLIDLNLRDGAGFSLIEDMKTLRPTAEAIVISAMEDEQHALHAFELGATGYLVIELLVRQLCTGGASGRQWRRLHHAPPGAQAAGKIRVSKSGSPAAEQSQGAAVFAREGRVQTGRRRQQQQ